MIKAGINTASELINKQDPISTNQVEKILDILDSIAAYTNKKYLELDLIYNDLGWYLQSYCQCLENFVR